MGRSVVFARFLHQNPRWGKFPSVVSQQVLKPYFSSSGFSQTSSPFSSTAPTSANDVSEEDRLKSLADLRRKYEEQTSVLRKKYAADILEKRLQKQKIEEEWRKEIDEQKAVRAIAKKERAAARAIEVAEEEKELQAYLKEQREESARQRARVEGREGYIRFKRMEAVRRQSSMWIEPKDLERRILEAIANPYHLAGSVGLEPLDRDDSYYEADEA
ncbi:unnamed protein product [Calypogeia fissa]